MGVGGLGCCCGCGFRGPVGVIVRGVLCGRLGICFRIVFFSAVLFSVFIASVFWFMIILVSLLVASRSVSVSTYHWQTYSLI